jgi:hypothetical protein
MKTRESPLASLPHKTKSWVSRPLRLPRGMTARIVFTFSNNKWVFHSEVFRGRWTPEDAPDIYDLLRQGKPVPAR